MASIYWEKNIHRYINALLTLIMAVVILYFGLWPKSPFMENNIEWLPDIQAIDFRHPGIAYLDDLNIVVPPQEFSDFTIHLRFSVHSVKISGFRPVLMIHAGSDKEQLTIWQWGSSIIAMNGDDYSHSRKLPRVSAYDVLTPEKIITVTLSSTEHYTRLYINGKLAAENRTWHISVPEHGEKLHVILGNSVYAKHGWQGLIYTIEIYTRALSQDEIHNKYENPSSPEQKSDNTFLKSPYLYLLRTQNVQDGLAEQGIHVPLLIPERVVILKKNVLAAPWHHFYLSRNSLIDIALNFLGFIPFGALFYLTLRNFSTCTKRTVKIAALTGCFLLSLVIEIGQIWQLTRYSSLLDLFFNTSGGYAGIILLSWKVKEQTIQEN